MFLAGVKKENLIPSLISGLKTVLFMDFVQTWWKFCYPLLFQAFKFGLPRHSENCGNAKLRAENFCFSCFAASS